ncbi:MAG: protocatechuate 3,4-dioxygenase beta subunit [Polaribacter sp.]|jgi:protocatechuate 3,4-dioxygenase beta subunit
MIMEKKKLLKIVATFGVATLLLSSFTEKFVSSDPFVEKLMLQLQKYNNHFSEEKVYLQLDRSFYQPNDYIWYSAWILNANSLRADGVSEKLYVELIDPKGAVMEKQTINAQNGLGNGGIKLNVTKGGLYKVKAYTKWQQNTETFFEREIQVQSVVLPNLKMKLNFDRKAYGAGDEVIAHLEAKDLEGQVLRLREFSYLLSLDGKLISDLKTTMDFDGNAAVKFMLPGSLETRDGLLQILIPHNGQTESISRAIPITFKNIDLQFFPEGGNLVAGLPSNVAFKALNEFGKPADVEGVILNKKGEEIGSFKSFHNGMGATKLWSERGGTYTAKITKPAGINTTYELPEVALRGLQMGVSEQNENGLRIKIQATRPQSFHLVAQANGKVLFAEAAVVDKEEIINVKTKDFPMGITKLSLFDEEGSVACERLVFINLHKRLNIEIKTDKKQYQPREKVKIDIEVKDHNGKPVAGNFALAVADDKLLAFADDKEGYILSKLFLESELKGKIEEPDFYFDQKEEKAIVALDHLMMTQGWRRFDWKEIRSDDLVAFEYLKEQSWISGRVVNGKNEPVEGAEVSIIGRGTKRLTNQGGYFIFEDLKIGDIGPVMKISYEGLPSIRKSIVEYKHDYHIVLASELGSILGLLLLPTDKEARDATVEIYNDNGSKWTTYTDRNGEYTFQQLSPGITGGTPARYGGLLPVCRSER